MTRTLGTEDREQLLRRNDPYPALAQRAPKLKIVEQVPIASDDHVSPSVHGGCDNGSVLRIADRNVELYARQQGREEREHPTDVRIRDAVPAELRSLHNQRQLLPKLP